MNYDDNNIFAKILRQEIPCVKVYEDDLTLAFMDIMPQTPGHTLVIPKQAAITIGELSDESALACIKTVQKIAAAIQKAMNIDGSSIFQLNGRAGGQTVPHCHFHVIPGALANLKGHALEMTDSINLEIIAAKIRNHL